MRRPLLAAALSLAVVTGGSSLAQAAPVDAAGHPAAASTPRLVPCTYTPTPDNPAARPVTRPLSTAPVTTKARAVVETNYGRMVFKLRRNGAPCAVQNFIHLARSGFYANSQCFRLTNNQRLGVLQCGDIIEQEAGGPGYTFDDEVDGTETYPRGTLAMGNQGPGTNGSEFFVVHSHADIKPDYTVFGRLVSGYRVLDAIAAAGIADGKTDGPPKEPVVIYDIRIKGGHRN